MKKDVTELKKMFLEDPKKSSCRQNAANFAAESLQRDYSVNGNEYAAPVLSTAPQTAVLPANVQSANQASYFTAQK